MAIDVELILAGISAAGASGAELAWFGPTGTAAPTNTSTALNVAFKSAGLVTEDGLEKALSESKNDIKAYGVFGPARSIVTSSEITFKTTFLESNLVAMAVYDRLPLTGGTAIAPDDEGAFSIQEGRARSQRYAAVFEVVDGENHIRMYCPAVEVTDREGFKISAGEAITRGVTLTAYPNSSGVSVETFYLIPKLATP